MKPRLFSNGECIPILRSWWKTHTGYEFRKEMTADHGIIVEDAQGKPLCMCFLYFPSNSKLCQISFITRNPQVSPIIAGRAIKLLVGFSVHACKKLGYDVIYAATANKAVQKALVASAYFASPEGPTTTEFTREL